MDISLMGFNSPQHSLHRVLNTANDSDIKSSSNINTNFGEPGRGFVQDATATATTPVDVKEYLNSYVFIIDMPGLKSGDMKVQVEDENVLVISGERKRENEGEKEGGVKYVRMERSIGKLMRKFSLPENANTDNISAVSQDGVLTVTIEKLPPREPKKPKTIQVQVA